MTKILLVEDEPRERAILYKWFLQRGYEVQVAATAGAAIVLGQTFQPHVLLTDWTLQDSSNGLDVAVALRALAPNLALIFFSGLSLDKLRAAARHLQPCYFLQKPLSPHRLEAAVKKALQDASPC
jgi:DNA-binding response OmpR family regulator